MVRYLFSILIVTCMAPFMFGCGEEAPIHEEFDETVDIDLEAEEAGEKQMKKDLR